MAPEVYPAARRDDASYILKLWKPQTMNLEITLMRGQSCQTLDRDLKLSLKDGTNRLRKSSSFLSLQCRISFNILYLVIAIRAIVYGLVNTMKFEDIFTYVWTILQLCDIGYALDDIDLILILGLLYVVVYCLFLVSSFRLFLKNAPSL